MATSFGAAKIEAFIVKRSVGTVDLHTLISTLTTKESKIIFSVSMISSIVHANKEKKIKRNLCFIGWLWETQAARNVMFCPDLPLFHPPSSYSFPRSSYQPSQIPLSHTHAFSLLGRATLLSCQFCHLRFHPLWWLVGDGGLHPPSCCL